MDAVEKYTSQQSQSHGILTAVNTTALAALGLSLEELESHSKYPVPVTELQRKLEEYCNNLPDYVIINNTKDHMVY